MLDALTLPTLIGIKEASPTFFINTGIGDDVTINQGAMICPNTILTTNIIIGKHCLIDRNTNIGHHSTLGDFFTDSPNVTISGNNNIKNCVFFGVSASTIENIYINL